MSVMGDVADRTKTAVRLGKGTVDAVSGRAEAKCWKSICSDADCRTGEDKLESQLSILVSWDSRMGPAS